MTVSSVIRPLKHGASAKRIRRYGADQTVDTYRIAIDSSPHCQCKHFQREAAQNAITSILTLPIGLTFFVLLVY